MRQLSIVDARDVSPPKSRVGILSKQMSRDQFIKRNFMIVLSCKLCLQPIPYPVNMLGVSKTGTWGG